MIHNYGVQVSITITEQVNSSPGLLIPAADGALVCSLKTFPPILLKRHAHAARTVKIAESGWSMCEKKRRPFKDRKISAFCPRGMVGGSNDEKKCYFPFSSDIHLWTWQTTSQNTLRNKCYSISLCQHLALHMLAVRARFKAAVPTRYFRLIIWTGAIAAYHLSNNSSYLFCVNASLKQLTGQQPTYINDCLVTQVQVYLQLWARAI